MFLISCIGTRVNMQAPNGEVVHLAYLSIYKGSFERPLHGSILFKPDTNLKDLNNIHSLDSFLCALYIYGTKFYDGSSVNFMEYDSLNRAKVQTGDYAAKLIKMYDKLLEERILFPKEDVEVIVKSARASVSYIPKPLSDSCSGNWLAYEYQVSCHCLSTDIIYLLTTIKSIYPSTPLFE